MNITSKVLRVLIFNNMLWLLKYMVADRQNSVSDLQISHTINRKSCNVHPRTHQPQPSMIIT